MGIFSKPKKTEVVMGPDPGYAARKRLLGAAEPGALERLRRAGEEYQGPLTAALSEFEETGLTGLKDWLGSEMPTEGEMYKSSVDQILKTLSEESNVEYREAYKTQALRELEEAKDRLASRAARGSKMFGGTRLGVEGEMEEDFLANLAVFQAELDERRKDRILRTIPQALGLTQYEEAAPLARVAASQQFGALPRLIEQAEMDADYQEWMRALNDLGIALDVATGLATYTPDYYLRQTGGVKPWVTDVGAFLSMGSSLFGPGGMMAGGGGGGGSGDFVMDT